MSTHIITMKEVEPVKNESARISVFTRFGGKDKGKMVVIKVRDLSKGAFDDPPVCGESICLTPFQAFHLAKVLEQFHTLEETGEVKEHE